MRDGWPIVLLLQATAALTPFVVMYHSHSNRGWGEHLQEQKVSSVSGNCPNDQMRATNMI